MTGPAAGPVLDQGAATDVGRVREVNQDAFLLAPPVYVVADGMGGHDGGEVASAIVVEEFATLEGHALDLDDAIGAVRRALDTAQERITAYSVQMRERGALDFVSGTTAVAAVAVADPEGCRWLLANLGDSRIYCFDGGALQQLSTDHSVVQELVDSGQITEQEAAHHPERHVVTRALGGVAPSEPDLFHVVLPVGGRLLLCSDGVSGMISDGDIAAILARRGGAQESAERLVAAAVEAGGRDNATALVVDVVGWADENPYDSARERAGLE